MISGPGVLIEALEVLLNSMGLPREAPGGVELCEDVPEGDTLGAITASLEGKPSNDDCPLVEVDLGRDEA